MAERGLEPTPAAAAALPPEVRAQLAELELELSEGRRRAGSGRRAPPQLAGTRSWPRALGAVRVRGAGGAGNLARAPEGLFRPLPPRGVGFPGRPPCPRGGREQGLGGEVLLGPAALRSPSETKLRPAARARAWRGRGEAASRAADSFLLRPSTLSRGGPTPVPAPLAPSPASEKGKKTHGKSSTFFFILLNNARCFPSDRSEREAGWAVEGPGEIRSSGHLPGETHTVLLLDHLCDKVFFSLVPVFGLNFPFRSDRLLESLKRG